jgi:hypothetical protein
VARPTARRAAEHPCRGSGAPTSTWTIDTLKEHLEQQLRAVSEKCASDVALVNATAKAAADALVKQAAEYERRLSDLNHEAARIAAANAANVSREVYEGDRATTEAWRRRTEAALSEAVRQAEFTTYKESTSKVLTLQEGKREGIQLTGQTVLSAVVGAAAVIAAAVGVATYIAARASSPAAAPVVYVAPRAAPAAPAASTVPR